jgi:YVTN family beta-propeller protein
MLTRCSRPMTQNRNDRDSGGNSDPVQAAKTLAGGPGTVTPIRTATNTALAPITVGQDPWAFAIAPDGQTIYVTNYQSGTVTPIRTATNTALAPIRIGESLPGLRDHPGRPDRLRGLRLWAQQTGHRNPDPDRHQPGAQADQGRILAHTHRDHPVATPLTRSPGRMLPGQCDVRPPSRYACRGTRP